MNDSNGRHVGMSHDSKRLFEINSLLCIAWNAMLPDWLDIGRA